MDKKTKEHIDGYKALADMGFGVILEEIKALREESRIEQKLTKEWMEESKKRFKESDQRFLKVAKGLKYSQ